MGNAASSLLEQFIAGQAVILDALPAHVALVAGDGRILAVNEAWRHFGRDNANPDPMFGVGRNYIGVCDAATAECGDEAHRVAAQLRTLLERQSGAFRIEYPCHSPDAQHWFVVLGTPIEMPGGAGALVMHFDVTERKLAEEESQRLSARMTTTLESISDAFYLLDREWRFSFLNDQAERLLRRPRAALLGRVIWEVFKGSSESVLYSQYQKAATEHVPAAFVVFYAPLQAWLDVRAYPSEEGLAVYFRDVTEQHAAEELLRSSEARFRAIARATADVIWDWDLVGETMWWSESVRHTFGLDPGDLGARPEVWAERIHPEDHDRVVDKILTSIRERDEFWEDEYRFVHRDGSFVDVHARASFLQDAGGAVVRMVGGMSDVTERKVAQARLAEQAALLDEAADAIVVRDATGRVRFWNHGAERMYGWTATEALGRPVEELLYANEVTVFRRVMATLLERGEWRGRIAQTRKDGSQLVVEANWSLVRDERGEPTSVMAINTDMTQRIALEDQLRQAQRLEAVGQLTGGVAHDFNNLLQVILGNAEALEEGLAAVPKLQSLARMTKMAAERGAVLTNRLLAFARRQALEPQPTDIHARLCLMDGLLRRTLGDNIEINVVRPAGLWLALVDAAHLENALLNLCINARDAMPQGGRLTIELANAYLDVTHAEGHSEVTPGPYVAVTVSDNGSGMPPDVVARSVEPFFTTKSIGKGSGLGLSTVYGFIKQSGGHMTIDSELDVGTTVKLFLPRADGEDRHTTEDPVTPLALGQGETILLVEVDEFVRQHVVSQLSSMGYRIVAVSNGADALAAIDAASDIDLLFTDVDLPDAMNGRELATLVRSRRPDLPILFSSGYAENTMLHRSSEESEVFFVNKPYRRGELSTKVRLALDAGAPQAKGNR